MREIVRQLSHRGSRRPGIRLLADSQIANSYKLSVVVEQPWEPPPLARHAPWVSTIYHTITESAEKISSSISLNEMGFCGGADGGSVLPLGKVKVFTECGEEIEEAFWISNRTGSTWGFTDCFSTSAKTFSLSDLSLTI